MTSSAPGVLFVLRGRPGLGHVIPGLALAHRVQAAGARVEIITYGAGSVFLSAQNELAWEAAHVRGQYREWPGIDLYENGVREIASAAERINARMLVLGGEYMAAPLGRALGLRSAMLYNPEIFDSVERNRVPGSLMATLFESCDLLVPLAPSAGIPTIPGYNSIAHKVVENGPFYLPRPRIAKKGEGLVMIANGGGTFFPQRAASYSTESFDIQKWYSQTLAFTDTAILSSIELSPAPTRIAIYSGLGEVENQSLRDKYVFDRRVEIHSVSPAYYTDLNVADLIVSRAGMGFIADLAWLSTPAVIWPLFAHEEQLQNSKRVVNNRACTWMAEDVGVLRDSIVQAWSETADIKREAMLPPSDFGGKVAKRIMAIATCEKRV